MKIELFIPLSSRSWVFIKWVFSNIIFLPSKKSVEFAISRRDFLSEKVFFRTYKNIRKTLK
ncbi:hypothetical protein LEP1GSC060_2736 [Leptospira weilii serovar Ranarum str. ICFT]|uniref:Uncharacterized protein n=1 Tax=Leptospira weilii serovar Ranarum str. ICFT TaxID=1218598 RepID=N1WG08_9LEPT|nr:hypothetical protein LEP1GSC060_2736 [Leptospira weilii serovar Ranarum str. ICFT]